MPDVTEIKLKYKPSEKQQQAHQSHATYVLYGGALGGGKSVALVNEMLQQALDWQGNRVAILRWENTTFKKTTYKTMAEWILEVPGLVASHNQSERLITLVNGSEILYGGIKPSASIGGEDPEAVLKSLEIGACGVDEVTEVPKKFYDVLCGRIGRLEKQATNAETGELDYPPPKMFCTCNPEPGWVKYQWVDQLLTDHEFIPALPTDNKYLPAEYIPRLRRTYPKEWVDKYLKGDWSAIMVFGALFPAAWIEAAMKRTIEPVGSSVFGVDVAREGDDKTVVVRRQGMRARFLLETSHQKVTDTVRQVAMLADKEKDLESINVDDVGVGGGVTDGLADLGYPVRPIVGGAAAIDPDKFLNLRAELHWELRQLLEDGRVDLPDDSRLSNEMGVIKRMIANDRKIQVESKEMMRKRGVPSPNLNDAMVYAYAGASNKYILSGLV